MINNFRKLAKLTLVLIYIVIIAGAVVRMTGSGMGCPDWPKCFGYYIPPTNIETLTWQKDKVFKKGQVIILNEALEVAKKDFTTGKIFNENNWDTYTKHDYSKFNVWHTWIEYINRLVSVLLGIPMLLLLVIAFFIYSKDKTLTIFTVISVFILGLQAVLGKIVVDTNLKTGIITVHMFFAFILMALVLFLIYQSKENKPIYNFDKTTVNLIKITALITLIQVVLGTQVREFVDSQITVLGENSKQLWLKEPTLKFYIHRSFSMLIVILNILLLVRSLKQNPKYHKIKWSILFILLSVITGVVMYYFNFPFSTQPLHLVIAALLFGIQFYIVLETRKSHKTS